MKGTKMDVIGPVSNGELLCLCAYAATAIIAAFLFNRVKG